MNAVFNNIAIAPPGYNLVFLIAYFS